MSEGYEEFTRYCVEVLGNGLALDVVFLPVLVYREPRRAALLAESRDDGAHGTRPKG